MNKTASNTYPFVKCLNPQVIRNKWTHEKMMVSCGHCEACLSRKSSMSTLKCRLESQSHKYAKFVTLTYDETHIPRMIPVHYYHRKDNVSCFDDYFRPYRYVEKKPRLNGSFCETLSPFEEKDTHYKLTDKVSHKYMPYLCKRDLQLFIKRLRRYYDRLSKRLNVSFQEIRYFACGEYGPVHFRPHYHLILWTSDEQVRKTLPKAVRSCWKLGRVSTETPREDVSKYVAKYVNGNCNLPQIFKSSKIKPFSIHSQHLGEAVFKAGREKIYESPTEEVIRKSLLINGSYSDVYMWRSLKAYYFPRCKAYDLCSPSERLYAYTIKTRANEILGNACTAEQARLILKHLYTMSSMGLWLYGNNWSDDVNTNKFYSYFIESCNIVPTHLDKSKYYESVFRSVYMVLRLSNHFINFCCNGHASRTKTMLQKIDNFYKDCDYLNLTNLYSDLEDFCEDWFEDEEEYNLCFSLYPEAITNTRIYKRFRASTINRFNDSMKHKKLNDLNRIFDKLK